MAAKGRAGGVLPINAAATKKEKSGQGHVKSSPRSQAPKLRLIVRRLPPGLTEAEFWAALGDEWQVGKGKVDWAAFKDGKVSKDPAKPSRPARGYLKVRDQALLDELSTKVRQTPFQDAKNTIRDPCLIGPPSLEFAPYNKLPSGRVRNDGRQGTIDQDQEFIDFLQSLTEPITKATANGADADATHEKITTTPLVQYLKEKKANKAKDAAEKKSSKARQQENKEGKQAKAEKSTVVVKGSNSTNEKARVNKATQETVKAINKSVASMQIKSASTGTKTEEKSPAKATPAATQPPTKRERGSAAAAARMVQRDLGLAPKAPRASRAAAAAAAASTPAATPTKTEAATTEKNSTPATDTKATAASTPTPTPPTGPRSTRNVPAAAATNTPSPAAPASKAASGPKVKAAPQPSPGAKSAFLKHANPSQGVTEDLLRTAFSTFGTVTRCEIDKKKGLGYIDFDETDGLRKAMASSPIKIGDKGGQVVVLENRNIAKGTKAAAAKSAATPAAAAATKADATPTASPKPAVATPVVAAPSPTAAETPSATKTAGTEPANTPAAASTSSPTTTPPTAPRGNAARGGGNPRGGRGGPAQAGRGGGRGGFRGRGYGRGRGGGGAAAGAAATAATSTTGTAQTAPAATATNGAGEAK